MVRTTKAVDEETRQRDPSLPDTMPCWACGGFNGITSVERKVVGHGPTVNQADPTATYELECGHRTIA